MKFENYTCYSIKYEHILFRYSFIKIVFVKRNLENPFRLLKRFARHSGITAI